MPSFRDLQQQFTAAVRNPDQHNMSGVEARRMAVYQELIFNNIVSFTQSAFPVALSIKGHAWWQTAVRSFLIHHRSQSPFFNEIAAEFLNFLRETDHVDSDSPAFLLELMHYEWVELALDNITQDTLAERKNLSADILNHIPVLSDAAWLLGYEYPVHRISEKYQPEEKQETLLLVYRKLDLSIGFRLMNPVFAMLWQQLQQNPQQRGHAAITQLATHLGKEDDHSFQDHAQQALNALYGWGAILGATPVNSDAYSDRT